MATAGGTVTIVQHMNHLAARVQAVVRKVDSLATQLDEMRGGEGSGADDALAKLREDVKRDVIRERAMMEASLEHRIDQQVNKMMVSRDLTSEIARLDKRLDELDATLMKLDAKIDTKLAALSST